MLNLVLGAVFALLALRGYWRGFVREAMDLAGALAGLILAFRFSYPTGDVLSDVIGASPWSARLISGGLIFVGVGVIASWIAARLQQVVDVPGLAMSNRVAGAGLAVLWGAVIATVVLSLGLLLPFTAVENSIDRSTVASALIDVESPTQRVLALISGDRAVEILLNLSDAVGSDRVTLGEGDSHTIPPVSDSDLAVDSGSAGSLLALVNEDRRRAGLEALTWSDELADLGLEQAQTMYRTGRLSHESELGDLATRAAGVEAAVVGENFALAADVADARRGLMDSPAHRDNLLYEGFDSIGIAAVDGPYGVMVVQVFSG